MWLEMLRYIMITNSLLVFLTHMKCAHLVYSLPLVSPVKFTASKFVFFFFSSGGIKMCIPSNRSRQASGSGEGKSRVSTCLVMTKCTFCLKQVTPSLVSACSKRFLVPWHFATAGNNLVTNCVCGVFSACCSYWTPFRMRGKEQQELSSLFF